MDRRGFLKIFGAGAGVVAVSAIAPGVVAGAGASDLIRRTQSGEPRVLLHRGAVMQNVTVENAAIDIQPDGPITIQDCMIRTSGTAINVK